MLNRIFTIYLILSLLATCSHSQPVLTQQVNAQAVTQAATAGYLASQSTQQAQQASQAAQTAQIASREAVSTAQFANMAATGSVPSFNGMNPVNTNIIVPSSVNGALNAAMNVAAAINGQGVVNGAINGAINGQYVNGAISGAINGQYVNGGINGAINGQYVNGAINGQFMNGAQDLSGAASAASSVMQAASAIAAAAASSSSSSATSAWDTSLGATWGLDILPQIWSQDAYPYNAMLDAASLSSWMSFANNAWTMMGQSSANWDEWCFKNFNNNWMGDYANAAIAGSSNGAVTMQIPTWVDQSAQTTWNDWSSLFSTFANGYGSESNGNAWNNNNNGWQSNGQSGQWALSGQSQTSTTGQWGSGPGQWGEGQWSPQGYGSGQGWSQGSNGWGQGSNVWGQGSNGWGQGSNGWGQGSNGWGQGSNGWGQGSNGWGQGSNGWGQGNNGWGQGSNGWGQGSNGWGQGSNGWGQGSNGWGQGSNGWGSNGWGQGYNGQGSNGWGSNGWGQGSTGYGGYVNGYGVQQGVYGSTGTAGISQCVTSQIGVMNQTISCPAGTVINSVQSAAFGQSPGVCPAVSTGGPCTLSVTNTVQRLCVNQNTCSITVSSAVLGAPTSNGQQCNVMNGVGQTAAGYGETIPGVSQQIGSNAGYTVTVQYTCGIAGPGGVGTIGTSVSGNRSLTFSDATSRSAPMGAISLALMVIAGMAV